MRSFRLTSAIAAAATALALAPAGASAAHANKQAGVGKHANPAGHCRVTIFAEPHIVISGESAQIFGQLICPSGVATTGQTVTVFEHVAGAGGAQPLPATTTGAGGFYSVVAPTLTANSTFYASTIGGRSATRAVKVSPQVTLKGPAETAQIFTGKRGAQTFSGLVSPADTGAEVVLQRENATANEEWGVIQRGIVGAGGAYSLTHVFGRPGDANLRVVVRAHRKLSVRGVSNTLSYSISQHENPLLTINTSADPISYGQPVTLTGVVAAGANKPVTLMARGKEGAFAPVASSTTDASGNYSFGQTPLQSTIYRVTSGNVSSALLFEGVKYILTAAASGTTVSSGQALTFSGTVTPAHVGHVVYLERQNVFGGGFHVVDVATVAADSTYSINHAIFGAGTEVFRVKVPGDPLNQAISSAPFSIAVTPAAPAALRPHAQNKLPGEGKV
jgi:hypothetical protein